MNLIARTAVENGEAKTLGRRRGGVNAHTAEPQRNTDAVAGALANGSDKHNIDLPEGWHHPSSIEPVISRGMNTLNPA